MDDFRLQRDNTITSRISASGNIFGSVHACVCVKGRRTRSQGQGQSCWGIKIEN